ncbi:ROK family transcriptional regulator [Neobacillus sp. 114]|uniref:ROK family transcriptional regulator n=1 Tax=Neobacillus sp. 114 TaxID=3048535 RepID=UPI0024C40D83|nr:ROK family transcriptional regulator [Neobacillus sp. 114]
MYIQNLEKLNNRDKILATLYSHRQLTKFDIAQKTNISIPTVTSNLTKLLEEGLVEEAGIAESTGGRKPKIIRLIPNALYSIGVEIAPTKVSMVLINLCCQIQSREEFLLDEFDITADFHRIILKLTDEIKQMVHDLDIPLSRIAGIGLSVPGTVDREHFVLELAPNLGVKQFSLEFLNEMFPFPIYIENEANAGAFGELLLGRKQVGEQTVYVSITEGIGASIMTKDGFYRGNKERAGEFGHMHIGYSEKLCKCGRTGCWELFSSETVLLDRYNQTKHTIGGTLDDIAAQYKAGDEDTKAVVSEYLNNLALGLQNILLAIDPKEIVIGGNLAKHGNLFIDELRDLVFEKSVFHSSSDVDILFSTLNADSSILGAAVTPFQKVFNTDEQ